MQRLVFEPHGNGGLPTTEAQTSAATSRKPKKTRPRPTTAARRPFSDGVVGAFVTQ